VALPSGSPPSRRDHPRSSPKKIVCPLGAELREGMELVACTDLHPLSAVEAVERCQFLTFVVGARRASAVCQLAERGRSARWPARRTSPLLPNCLPLHRSGVSKPDNAFQRDRAAGATPFTGYKGAKKLTFRLGRAWAPFSLTAISNAWGKVKNPVDRLTPALGSLEALRGSQKPWTNQEGNGRGILPQGYADIPGHPRRPDADPFSHGTAFPSRLVEP
jgi:hypothetical protein